MRQRGSLLGLGASAYSRFGSCLFRDPRGLDHWLRPTSKGARRVNAYYFVTEAERAEGGIMADIRGSTPKAQLKDLARRTSRATRTWRLLERLPERQLLQQTDEGMHTTALVRAFEEEICWLFFSGANRQRAERLHRNVLEYQ